MRVQLHGLTHDVRGFGAVAVQQAHLVHGVQQLAVGRLEAVNLRDRAGHDNAHRVRHVVLAQRVRDALIDRRVFFIYFWFVGFLFCHYALPFISGTYSLNFDSKYSLALSVNSKYACCR